MKKIIISCIISLVLICCTFMLTGCHHSSSKKEDTFTVVWKNYDGTVLETDNNVKKGTTAKYDGTTPLRQEDEVYLYEFIGWDKEVSSVNEDVIYVAKYKAVNKQTGETKYGDLTIGEWDNVG